MLNAKHNRRGWNSWIAREISTRSSSFNLCIHDEAIQQGNHGRIDLANKLAKMRASDFSPDACRKQARLALICTLLLL